MVESVKNHPQTLGKKTSAGHRDVHSLRMTSGWRSHFRKDHAQTKAGTDILSSQPICFPLADHGVQVLPVTSNHRCKTPGSSFGIEGTQLQSFLHFKHPARLSQTELGRPSKYSAISWKNPSKGCTMFERSFIIPPNLADKLSLPSKVHETHPYKNGPPKLLEIDLSPHPLPTGISCMVYLRRNIRKTPHPEGCTFATRWVQPLLENSDIHPSLHLCVSSTKCSRSHLVQDF